LSVGVGMVFIFGTHCLPVDVGTPCLSFGHHDLATKYADGRFVTVTREVTMPSTAIRRMRYDAESHILSVWFVPSGQRYDYFDVPEALYDAFRMAGSKGHFFNTRIRDHFAYRQVPEGAASKPNFATIHKL
jgi:hypothetical protein